MRKFIKKLTYVLVANVISMLISLITTVFVPAFFGNDIIQYGYYQIFMFYVGYVGFFHFGWCDGLYLRDGGKSYHQLNYSLYSIQFRILIVLEVIIALFLIIFSLFFDNNNYSFIIVMIAINVLLLIPQTMLSHILQATNRMKEYAYITIACRGIYGIILICIFLFGYKDFRIIVIGYNISYMLSFIISLFLCHDIVFSKASSIFLGIIEAKINIGIGIKLLFANIASFLVTGIVRWGIQMEWDVVTYGKISFTLSITNMILVFINATSLVLYPIFKQKDNDYLVLIYIKINNFLMIFTLGILVFYYPISILLTLWLPQYNDSLEYMAILFPICLYSAKMNLLVITYMKVFRFEKLIMLLNICGVFIATITTSISVFLLHNLNYTILSIVFNQMLHYVLAEFVLARKLKINILTDTLLECTMSVLFIVFNWGIGGWMGMILYLLFYAILIYTKRKNIVSDFYSMIKFN